MIIVLTVLAVITCGALLVTALSFFRLIAIEARVSDLSESQQRSSRGREEERQELGDRINQFGDRLEGRFARLEDKTEQRLEGIRKTVDERLFLIGKEVQGKLDENLREGFKHFEKVQEHLKAAEAQLVTLGAVGASIGELNSLLKLPHLRGGFGEASLEGLLADFLPANLYELKAQVKKGSQERVDAVVLLPRARLPIDSKFPREQVLPLFESSEGNGLAEARKTLAQIVKIEAKSIAQKYISPEDGTTDLALMFLPSETLYFEVVRDLELWGFLAKEKVFPVSPNTLAVTLKGISLSYDYYEMAKGVEQTIEEIRKAQRHFGNFQKQFDEIGQKLQKAQDAFSTAQGHLSRYSGVVIRLTGEETAELPAPEVSDG